MRSVSYRRRVEHPQVYAGHAMVEALRSLRIQVPRRISSRKLPQGLALLAVHRSPPLSQIVYAMGKLSDNFTAEMLLKVLAAERKGTPAHSADGARLALEFLEASGVPPKRAKIINGSGLFSGNQLAAAHLVKLLVRMYGNPAVRSQYVSHLAVGGVDGTLVQRLKRLPRSGIVRAKTGTLADVIALSGYVLGPRAGRTMAFSFLANGVRGKHHATRQLADNIVAAIAEALYSKH